ncbi:MAG: hypothetical protein KME43_21475 [Myxacorys chilensis ATA2-1-KO14]|jgi:DNA-binding MarR family transcriptional regulator|nr:hypothetical protein [Myxacorys chilensis ATA2-1-KO14]
MSTNPFTGEIIGERVEPNPPTDWTVKRQVQEYFEENNSASEAGKVDRGCYASTIAREMNLKWADVTKALEELHKEVFLTRSKNHTYRRSQKR